MPTPSKLNQVVGILAALEADYGVFETLTAADDGCDFYIGDGLPEAPRARQIVYDGMIGRASGTLAPQRGTTPNGFFREDVYRCLPKGTGGTAYSASVTPPKHLHRWLQAAGFNATFSATPTPQWSYTPTPHGTDYESLSLRHFAQGSQYDSAGVLSNFTYAAEGLGVPIWSFDWRGLVPNNPADQALPAITVDAPAVLPPVASDVTFEINSVTTLVLRSISYNRNRRIETPRPDQNTAGGHLGFVPGGATPEFTIEIEAPTRSVFDPEALERNATVFPFAYGVGGTQYNRWRHSFANAQVRPGSVELAADGDLAVVRFVVKAVAASPSDNAYESIVFN